MASNKVRQLEQIALRIIDGLVVNAYLVSEAPRALGLFNEPALDHPAGDELCCRFTLGIDGVITEYAFVLFVHPGHPSD